MSKTTTTDDLVTCTIAAAERPLYERRCDGVAVSTRKPATRGERLLGFDSAGRPIVEGFEVVS